jgi:molecular chaperone GrpE
VAKRHDTQVEAEAPEHPGPPAEAEAEAEEAPAPRSGPPAEAEEAAAPPSRRPDEDGTAPIGDAAPAEPVGGAGDDLAALAAARDEYLELAQRTRADFENYRKRMGREVAAAEGRGAARLAKELLPALDNLHLALAAETGDGAFAEGVKLVQRELLAALGRAGIEPYVPMGERFDPVVHEAVAQHVVEGAEPGTIVEVMQHGYRHGDSVLRPARVLVAG